MAEPYVNLEEQGSIYSDSIYSDPIYSDPLDALLIDEHFIDEDYHGAVIDMDGVEQPITEEMILDACAALEKEIDSIYGNEFSGK